MADNSSVLSPTDKHTKPTSSFFATPRLFTSLTSKGSSETEAAMSPTSILETKPFFGLRNPFWSETTNTPKTPEPEARRHWDKLDSKGIGLGIVDALNNDDDGSDPKPSMPQTRMVIFGSQLKIQIPPLPPASSFETPKSQAHFDIKTRNSQLGSFSSVSSHSPAKKSPFESASTGLEALNSPQVFTGSLSVSEMELSEDYTCVIAHGPNPRTTHIFDNCIVESSGGVPGFAAKKENESSYPSESFLSFCYNCKKHIGQGKDIYMYRGEKAFCSSECRYQEMLLEEGVDKMEEADSTEKAPSLLSLDCFTEV